MGSNPIIMKLVEYSLTVEHCFLVARGMGSNPITPNICIMINFKVVLLEKFMKKILKIFVEWFNHVFYTKFDKNLDKNEQNFIFKTVINGRPFITVNDHFLAYFYMYNKTAPFIYIKTIMSYNDIQLQNVNKFNYLKRLLTFSSELRMTNFYLLNEFYRIVLSFKKRNLYYFLLSIIFLLFFYFYYFNPPISVGFLDFFVKYFKHNNYIVLQTKKNVDEANFFLHPAVSMYFLYERDLEYSIFNMEYLHPQLVDAYEIKVIKMKKRFIPLWVIDRELDYWIYRRIPKKRIPTNWSEAIDLQMPYKWGFFRRRNPSFYWMAGAEYFKKIIRTEFILQSDYFVQFGRSIGIKACFNNYVFMDFIKNNFLSFFPMNSFFFFDKSVVYNYFEWLQLGYFYKTFLIENKVDTINRDVFVEKYVFNWLNRLEYRLCRFLIKNQEFYPLLVDDISDRYIRWCLRTKFYSTVRDYTYERAQFTIFYDEFFYKDLICTFRNRGFIKNEIFSFFEKFGVRNIKNFTNEERWKFFQDYLVGDFDNVINKVYEYDDRDDTFWRKRNQLFYHFCEGEFRTKTIIKRYRRYASDIIYLDYYRWAEVFREDRDGNDYWGDIVDKEYLNFNGKLCPEVIERVKKIRALRHFRRR